MKKFFKNLWKAFLEGPDMEPEIEEEPSYFPREDRPKHKAWCPHCGWSGTNVEFMAHLQNYHSNRA